MNQVTVNTLRETDGTWDTVNTLRETDGTWDNGCEEPLTRATRQDIPTSIRPDIPTNAMGAGGVYVRMCGVLPVR